MAVANKSRHETEQQARGTRKHYNLKNKRVLNEPQKMAQQNRLMKIFVQNFKCREAYLAMHPAQAPY